MSFYSKEDKEKLTEFLGKYHELCKLHNIVVLGYDSEWNGETLHILTTQYGEEEFKRHIESLTESIDY